MARNVVEFSLVGHDRMSKAFKSAGTAMDRVRGKMQRISASVFTLKTGIVSLIGAAGVAGISKSFLDAANTSEQLRVRLNVLLGSVEEGNRLFQDMSEFAAKVPFQYEQIMESATALSGVMKGGVDEINSWMPMIADLAAVSGLTLQQTTEQIIRMYSAGAGAADLFRERGILAMLDFQAGVSYSAEETKEQLIKAFEDPASKFRGAAIELAATWDGLLSMMSDKWFQFRKKVMDAGLFNYIKSIAMVIDQRMGRALQESDQFARSFAQTVIDGIGKAAEVIGVFADGLQGMRVIFQGLKVVGLGFFAAMITGLDAMTAYWRHKMEPLVNLYNFFADDKISLSFANLSGAADLARQKVVEAEVELHNLAMQEMPSDQIKQFMDDVNVEFDKLQQKAIETSEVIKENPPVPKIEDLEAEKEKITTYYTDVGTIAEEFHNNMGGVISNMVDGTSRSIAGAITGATTMSKAFQQLTKQIAADMIAVFIKMGIQRILLATLTKGAIASEASAGASKAIGLAFANGVASWAAAPWPINMGAPAFGAAMAGTAAAGFASGAATGAGLGASIGARAMGGSVNSNMPYLVGERGPEIFRPSMSGEIIPNNEIGGGGTVIIEQVNISVLENATNADAILSMSQSDINEIIAGPFITGLNSLGRQGIRPDYVGD